MDLRFICALFLIEFIGTIVGLTCHEFGLSDDVSFFTGLFSGIFVLVLIIKILKSQRTK